MPSGTQSAWMPGYVSAGPPPRFTGLPLFPDELAKYNEIVAWWNKGSWQVLKGQNALNFSDGQYTFVGPQQAWALLMPLSKLIQQRYAERRATLPPNASSHQDQYTHEPSTKTFASGSGYPWLENPYHDEYGRVPEGKPLDLTGAALDVLAIVAPYVPVIGPELAFVVALAQGKSLEDAALQGIRAALPGGPAAQIAFDVGVAVAMGEDPDAAAMQALWNQYPEGEYYYELGKMALGGEPDVAALNYLKSQPGGQPVAQALIVKNEEENANKIDFVLPLELKPKLTLSKALLGATVKNDPAKKEASERNLLLSTVGGCIAGAGAGFFAGRAVVGRRRRGRRATGGIVGAVAGLVLGGIVGGVAYKAAT